MKTIVTPEQVRALASAKGESLRLTDPNTLQDYVLIKAELYDRLRNLLNDDAVCTTAEMLDRVMAEDDLNDPQLAEWQKKYRGMAP